MKERQTLKLSEWIEKGVKLFGKDRKKWKFKCVKCGHVQTAQDFIDMKIEEPEKYIGFSCIGRFKKGVGCDWTLGGLFTIHTLEIIDDEGTKHPRFEFA